MTDLAAEGDRLERERQRARECIAEWFEDEDGMPDFNKADAFISDLDYSGYDIVPNWRRDGD